MTSRERMLVGVTLAAALCGGAAVGAARLVAGRDAADAAAADLAECRRLAGAIETRRGPSASSTADARRGAAGDAAGAEVTRRIESAAKSAGLPAGGIERIEPAPVRPVEGGAGGRGGSEKPTNVQLRGVTLRQVLTFFQAVGGAGRPSLRLSQVHLTAAAAPNEPGDRWAVESTLTYPVRSPTADDHARSENDE